MRMGKKGSMRESLLSLVKSLSHGRSPGRTFGSTNQSICEWSKNGGSTTNKTAIEIDEAKKALEILDSGRLRIVKNSLDVRGKRSDTSGCNIMAKEINRRLGKGALGRIDQDTVGGQEGKELVKMAEVLRGISNFFITLFFIILFYTTFL